MSADTNYIKPGMRVLALDAFGEWRPMVATTSVEGVYDAEGRRIHDFPVIWVRGSGDPIPWPASHVKFDARADR